AELRGLRDDLERKQRRAGDGTTTSRKARRSSQASVRKLEERSAALESEIEGIQSKLTDTFAKTKPSTRTAQQQQPHPKRHPQRPQQQRSMTPEIRAVLNDEGVPDAVKDEIRRIMRGSNVRGAGSGGNIHTIIDYMERLAEEGKRAPKGSQQRRALAQRFDRMMKAVDQLVPEEPQRQQPQRQQQQQQQPTLRAEW